jgi:hypothetical protein
VRGWRRKLHKEKLHNLDFPPDIVRMIKSRRMRWVGHVARMGEMKNAYKFLLSENLNRTNHLRDLGVYGRIILKYFLRKSVRVC